MRDHLQLLNNVASAVFGAAASGDNTENAPPETLAPQWAVELELTTDSTQRMRIRCGPEGPGRICQRDDGPLLRLRTREVTLATDVGTFADRDLLRIAVDDVRALEITGQGTPRQSVHFDLGLRT